MQSEDSICTPVVSIICAAYNHEKYIRKCLDGFLMQEATFPFEVLVHDDASTDRTADIIREYEHKYPTIIKPIYQSVNQYSKGVRITGDVILPLAKGSYIAFCEGDDWWCDSQKLQMQFDFMEQHPECSLCTHKVAVCNENGDFLERYQPAVSIERRVYSPEEFFHLLMMNSFPQTSSYFFRTEVLEQLYENEPEFRKICPVGDVPMLMFAVAKGSIFFIEKVMSCYRKNSNGSWTSRVLYKDKQKLIDHFKRIQKTIFAFDEYTQFRFHDDCLNGVWIRKYLIAVKTRAKSDYRELIRWNPRCFFKQSLRMQLSVVSSAYFPWVLELFRKIKNANL